MKSGKYIKDRLYSMCIFVAMLIISVLMMAAFKVSVQLIIAEICIMIICYIAVVLADYYHRKKFYDELEANIAALEEKYLITETLVRPAFYEGQIFYDSVSDIDRSMTENVKRYRLGMEQFKEYVEMWIHEIKLPQADAIVNPKQEDCPYPFDKLCGAGVAFKVIKILYERLGLNPIDLEEYAELMAIATIGDVVDLSDENRVIVKYGLKHLAVTTNIGIRALVEACELEIDKISSYHIGFVIGPCLNATGRLDSARRAIELLLTTDMEDARNKALELRTLNVERKDITEEYAAIAIEQVENTELKDDKVLVVYLPDCHESVAGIIAGRVREKFYRPSIVITKAEDGAKGSGRSIEGYNMFEEISKCGKLLNKYGGHPMAAGISLDIDKIDEFRKALNENQTMTENVLTPTVWIDVPMPVDYVDIKLIKQFEKLQPFGKGNEKPVFADRNLTVRQSAVIGKNKNVLRCQLESEHGKLVTAIRFKLDGQEIPEIGRKISMVYYPDINEYNGIVSIQFRIEDWRYV